MAQDLYDVNKLVAVMIHHIEKENKKNEMSYLQSEVKVLYNLSPETDESNALDVILGISITESGDWRDGRITTNKEKIKLLNQTTWEQHEGGNH